MESDVAGESGDLVVGDGSSGEVATAVADGSDVSDGDAGAADASGEAKETGPKKFGTFTGVFTPTLLTIFGVIMYVRVGWSVGNAGLVGT